MCQHSCEQYGNFSGEERKKKHQCGPEQYKYLPEDEKRKLINYMKNCFRIKKLINTS